MTRGVPHMLYTIQPDRLSCANVELAFEVQHGCPMRVQQHTQPDAKGNPSEWLRKGQGERAYLYIMRIGHSGECGGIWSASGDTVQSTGLEYILHAFVHCPSLFVCGIYRAPCVVMLGTLFPYGLSDNGKA